MLDFIQYLVAVFKELSKATLPTENNMAIAQVVPIYEVHSTENVYQTCAIFVNQESEGDILDDYALPSYNGPSRSELPTCTNPKLYCVIEKYCKLYCTKPGYKEDAWHYIPAVGNPVKVPPQRIPTYYHTEVYQQIETMLDEGIIRCIKSPWMAPAVFVPKKPGQL